ncbi:TRAP transporter small permease [Sulfitobacter sp. HNIBRBA2951]|uniref:TRAP transporter small permease n=1 Tax=Sulfitobacter aquimarinus TaxID=3158557 RepID=UPI0032E023A6
MKTIGKIISWLNTAASGLAGILVLCMVAHVSADVTMRFVFEKPLDSTILYVSAFYMVAIAFLPLGLVEQKDSHIAVELLVETFPSKLQTALLLVATVITAIVTAAVAVRTGQEALGKYAAGAYSIESGGKVITWPTYFFLPVGFGMMSLVAIWKAIAMITGKESGLSGLVVEDPYLSEEEPNV